MKLKVNLQITGTIEEIQEGEQETLFDHEGVTDAQLWRLTTDGLPAFIVEQLTKKEAGKLIGMYETRKRNKDVMSSSVMPVKSVMEQFVDKREEKEEVGELVPLPWEKTPIECSYIGCNNPAKVKGFCQKHYMVVYKAIKKTKGKTK